MFCTFCIPKTPIDVRNHAQYLNEDIWSAYLAGVTESAVIKEQQRFEKILEQHVSLALTPIEKAMKTVESLTLPSCPKCQTVIVAFDGCCALVCGRLSMSGTAGCGALLCAWCFGICPKEEHSSHVAYCIQNPRPGEVFPESKEAWLEVQHKLARDRVLKFLSTVNRELATNILTLIAKDYPQLHLKPSSSSAIISLGPQLRPQPAPRHGTFLGNVDVLVEMEIATRSRAEQVLESCGNDLQAAIDLLLASASHS